MKVVLLAGGLGSRLAEETTRVPKPMVEIGGRPIILHVMDIYSQWGFRDFIVAGGYKCMSIKAFFHNFHLSTADFTVALGSGAMTLRPTRPLDWNVSVVDTGLATMTGGRLLLLRDWIGHDTIMVTYSDGVGNIDLNALLAFHRSHGRLATVTAVQPPARFGALEIENGRVVDFSEKVRQREAWINGGFFVFEPGVLDYITSLSEPLEQSPLSRLARDGELHAFQHDGFWHPMDTIRDRDHLDGLCRDGAPPWLETLPDCPATLPMQMAGLSARESLRREALGFHPAPLPRFRGRAVIPWTILSGETTSGSTLFWLDEGVDSGPILAQRHFSVAPDETARSLYEKHKRSMADLVPSTARRIASGDLAATRQDEAEASYCAKRTADDGFIDWREPAGAIERLVRAVGDPYPGAFAFDGERRIRIDAARLHAPKGRHIGLVGQVQSHTSDGFTVLCGDGATIEITAWDSEDTRLPKVHAKMALR